MFSQRIPFSDRFAAIRFVLASDKYQRKLPAEEKKNLLHVRIFATAFRSISHVAQIGAGGTTLLGYVEIELDNSDKRLPV